MTIPSYYSGKTIAITGGTGFIGQCLIEKLLRSCPGIKKIILLMRPKRNCCPKERIKHLTELPIFDCLREQQPDFINKITSLESNLEEEYLGLSEESKNIIKNEVNVVFHSAATIRFNEHLRHAFSLNTLAVKHLLDICNESKNLEALVHISTAYSNCDRKGEVICEEIYDMNVSFHNISSSLTWMNDHMIEKITPEVRGSRPNTYTLTKALAECVIAEDQNNIPIVIVRPSIVGPTWSDPVPGWVSNFNGATGILVALGKGMLQSLKVGDEIILDVVPVDFTVNALIAAGWKKGTESAVDKKETKGTNLTVYNITTGSYNPNYLDIWRKSVLHWFENYPLNGALRYPYIALTNSEMYHRTMMTMFHYVPAYLFDFGLKLSGKKPRFMKMTNKINEMLEVLRFFLSNKWKWNNDNLMKLLKEMSKEDRKNFNFDPRTINWHTYTKHYAIGARKYLLKEDPEGYPAARRHIKRLRVISYAMHLLTFMVLWRLLVARSGIAQNLWHFVTSMWFKFLRFFQISSTVHPFLIFKATK